MTEVASDEPFWKGALIHMRTWRPRTDQRKRISSHRVQTDVLWTIIRQLSRAVTVHETMTARTDEDVAYARGHTAVCWL